jgi:hypothetical protein
MWGEADFSICVSIQLEKEIGHATLVMHTLPVKIENLSAYPGWVEEGRTYPSLVLHAGAMRLGPLSMRNMGMPLMPYVWSVEQEMPDFMPKEIRKSVRMFMVEVQYARTAPNPRDLAVLVGGPEAPDITLMRQPWTWPGLEEDAGGEGTDEDENDNDGNNNILSIFIA